MAATAAAADHQRRADVVRWIRRTHGWFGLWGAVLGLLMGFSGIFLNHRNVLKLSQAQERSRAQLALPDPVPDTP
ncbi:MAG: peptidase, partial [Variovorax sp.]|nr:peptidase [Variovorax sp.]